MRFRRFNFWMMIGMLGLFLAASSNSLLKAQIVQQASGNCVNALNRIEVAYPPLPPTEGQSASVIYFYNSDAGNPSQENVVYATVSCGTSNSFIYYSLTRVINGATPQIALDIFRVHANACIAFKGTPILEQNGTIQGQNVYRLRCNFKYKGEPSEDA